MSGGSRLAASARFAPLVSSRQSGFISLSVHLYSETADTAASAAAAVATAEPAA